MTHALARPAFAQNGALLVLCGSLGLLAGFNPLLAIAAALAAAFTVVVTSSLTTGLYLFVVVSFAERLPALAGSEITLVKVLGLLLVLSWLAAMTTSPSGPRQIFSENPGVVMLAGVWIAWLTLSTTWAEDGAAAWTDVIRYALNLTLIPIVFAAVRRREHVVTFLGVYITGAVLCGLQGLLAGADPEDGLERSAGVAGTANELASLLLTGAVLAAGLALAARRSPVGRAVALTAVAICLFGLFTTLSRSGLIGLGVVLVVGLAAAGRWRAGAALLMVAVTLTTAGYFSFVASEQASDRVSNFGSGTGRTDLWTVAWRMVEDRPLQGVGVGNFRTASIHYLLEPGAIVRDDFIVDRPQLTHNSYLQLLSETGLPGLVGFLGLLGAALACCARAAHDFERYGDRTLELCSRAVMLALIGIYVTGFFASDQLNKELWLLVGLGPALLALSRPGSSRGGAGFAS